MGRTVRLVLGGPGYALLALLVGLAGLSLFVLSLNTALAGFALAGDLAPGARLRVLLGLYPFVGSAYGPIQGGLLVLVSVLLGVDVAMATYHFRVHRVTVEAGGASAAGVLLGTLGAGCAACGVPILLGVLSLLGLPSAALLLPFDGLEFAALAAVVLVLSVHWLADGMRGGEIRGCPVDP
ncbi:MAG: hypothetical protein V5A85_08845 [Haloarculaceae archaeon]